MKRIILSTVFLCFSLLIVNAQCTFITLTTQAEVNNFACSGTITALTIDDGGTGNITTLDPIFFSGLTDITAWLHVKNCPNLTSLLGLDAIKTIGGKFLVQNTGITEVSPAAYPLQLETVGTVEFDNNDNLISCIAQFPDLWLVDNIIFYNNGALEGIADFYDQGIINSLRVRNNPNLMVVNGFSSTSVVDFIIEFEDNPMLNFIPSFNTLQTASYIVIDNTALTALENFGNMTSCGVIEITNNTQLSSISAFDNVTGLTGADLSFSLGIVSNPNLTEVTGFSSLTLVVNANGGNALTVTNNTSLSDCCWLLPIIAVSVGVTIQNNASGCNSIADIGSQAPVLNCINDVTLSTDSGACSASVSYTDPIPIDDCDDLASYTLTLTGPDGTVILNQVPGDPGQQYTYVLDIGVSTFEFVATDGSGYTSVCSTSVTIIDDVAPTWAGGGNSMTINAVCGVDNLNSLYNANVPTAVDNCGTPTVFETTTLNTICGASTTNVYTFNAEDEEGNMAVPYTLTINLEDNTDPQFSNVPADVTISCNDNFPNIPTPTATDVCAGNLNNAIVSSSSITIGDCSFNSFAEIHDYTWSVDDGCGNISTANWSVTVISDFSFDLGPDITECNSNSYTINPGNIGSTYEWSTGATSQTLTVNNSGNYSLTVTTNNGCCYIDDIDVILGFSPNASATGNTLDCSGSSVTIFGSSTSSGVTYSWTGPGGFTSTAQNPSVSELGIYTLTVTNAQMCTATATAEVIADVNVPDVTAIGGIIDCINPSVILMGASSVSGVSYNWTGPGGFNSNLQNPEVSLDGIYTLEVTAPNGCSASQSTTVELDADIPSISLSIGDADCDNESLTLISNSNTNGLDYSWTGPNGFTATTIDAEVFESGTYTLRVTAANGCANDQEIEVEIDFDFTTTINTTPASGSDGGTAEIIIDGGTEPFTISWDNGTTGFTTSNLSVGTHTVTIQDGYACIRVEEFEITTNTASHNQELETKIQVYPNPFKNQLQIKLDPTIVNDIKAVLVHDLKGALIYQEKNLQQLNVNLQQLPVGLYILEVQLENSFFRKKIMKTE